MTPNLPLTYAGHSAVFINFNHQVVAIDPWLKGNPLCPQHLIEPKKLDIIALTHGHADHASDVVRLSLLTGAKVVATYELAMILVDEGIPNNQIVPMNKGGCVKLEGFTVRLTDAYHSSSYDGKKGTLYAGEACGVVVSDETGNCVYHAGDTSLFSDMKLIGELYRPTLALLPIGDRFTMGPKEAARAAKMVGAKVTAPIHYKTFELLTGTYEEFASECAALGVNQRELEIG
jgi:L-ascorbate metabolism protein UlaG (beta-lactamase superfamily)